MFPFDDVIMDSQSNFLHFELSMAVLAKKLTDLWHFRNLIYFLTSWPRYLTFDLKILHTDVQYWATYMDQV